MDNKTFGYLIFKACHQSMAFKLCLLKERGNYELSRNS